MELVLNLIWVACSAATFAAVMRGAVSRRCAAAIAICLAAIAFPIISITDDLANGAMLADTSAIRRTVHHVQLRPFAIAADLPQQRVPLTQPSSCGSVVVADVEHVAHADDATADVRGPPLRFF